MKLTIYRRFIVVPVIAAMVFFATCDTIFGSKYDETTEEIFEVGRIDPQLENVDGYAPVLPFWGGFDEPNDVFIGFDTFVYVTDNEGVHLLDRADLTPRQTFPLEGASAVVQDRLLNVYVAARIKMVVPEVDPTLEWDLPAIFKIKNLNGAGELTVLDTLIFPFDDISLTQRATQIERLDKNSPYNYELVKITGLSVLADNTLYVSRIGPKNDNTQVAAPDNQILAFGAVRVDGELTDKMQGIGQVRSLSPDYPSLLSAIGVSDIQTLVAPPQRDNFTDQRDFLIAQADTTQEIPYRVLWVDVEETINGTEYLARTDLLAQDTSRADGFLYEPFKFQQPSGLAFAGDNTQFIFVVDEAQHKLYQFQSNGEEGVDPPAGVTDEQRSKKLIVSFGGFGSEPKQFKYPSGVAYFNKVVYVADKGNNRISRFKLTSDFE